MIVHVFECSKVIEMRERSLELAIPHFNCGPLRSLPMRIAHTLVGVLAVLFLWPTGPSMASNVCSWASFPMWPGHIPKDGETIGSVTAIGPNDVWAAGDALSPGFGHWDGVRWSILPVPGFDYLGFEESISATADNNIWAVGWGSHRFSTGPYALHFDGSSWTQDFLPLDPSLIEPAFATHVRAFSANDVWAIGWGYTPSDTIGSFVDRWNGTTWNSVKILPPKGPNGLDELMIYDVSGTSGSDVWLLGFYIFHNRSHVFIEHFDGNKWSIVPNPAQPNPHLYHDPDLAGIYAKSPSNAWVVGSYSIPANNPNGQISLTYTAHWNGSIWSYVPSPSVGARHQDNYLTAVSGSSTKDIWAVGYVVSGAALRGPLGLHWNGISWNAVQRPEEMGTGIYRAVVDISPKDVWAIGVQTTSSGTSGLLQSAFWCTPTTR
ncbi:MAG TPA: hypothetical protein VII69_01190 [Candidatus Eremiobacteraceae bacterium]